MSKLLPEKVIIFRLTKKLPVLLGCSDHLRKRSQLEPIPNKSNPVTFLTTCVFGKTHFNSWLSPVRCSIRIPHASYTTRPHLNYLDISTLQTYCEQDYMNM